MDGILYFMQMETKESRGSYYILNKMKTVTREKRMSPCIDKEDKS